MFPATGVRVGPAVGGSVDTEVAVEVTAGKGVFVTPAPRVGVPVDTDGPVAIGAGVNETSGP